MRGTINAVIVGVVCFCGSAGAASVTWIDGIGAVAPSGWSISPSSPTPTSVITFKGPTDKSYGNSCAAEKTFGGKPYLSINPAAKTIELKFQGPPPTVCTLILKPAVGFQGDFGPLAAGTWTFKCTNSLIAFQLTFTVSGVSGDHVIRVDKNSPTLLGADGSSWTKAYRSLHDGLAAAQPGDTVRVAKGTYTPDDGTGVSAGDRAASFAIPDNVTVLCGYAGYGAANPDARAVEAYPTILSGDLQGNDLWGILNIGDNSYHVVSASGAGLLDGATITAGNANGSGGDAYGGGVLLKGSSLRINACKIRGNKASFGGGVAVRQGVAPVLLDTEVTGNWALVFGGGLYNENANLQMTNCLLVGNTAGSADILGSDAILNSMGSLDITNCTIADNRPGHGVAANQRAIVNLIWGPTFVDSVSIKNSIIRNGGNEIWSTEPSIVTLYYNNLEGGPEGYPGFGNIDKDPLFKSPGAFGIEGGWFFTDDGYTLGAGSASIDAGNVAYLPAGLTTDLNGNARVQGGQVDQGAYEGAGLPPAVVLVPSVVGQTQSAAQATLTSYGLAVGTVSQAYSDTVTAGLVISQSPSAGSTAIVGSAVNLTISQGPAPGSTWVLQSSYDFWTSIPSPVPSSPIMVTGGGSLTYYSSTMTDYKLEVIGIPGVGGSWTVNPATGTFGIGENTINFTIQGLNVNVSSLSPGGQRIAELRLYTR